MEKPKIFVFTTSYFPFIGGAEVAIREIASRLCGEFDFYIICARQKRELSKKEIRPEGTVIRLGLGNKFDKWLLPAFCLYLHRSKIYANRGVLLGIDVSQGSLTAALVKFLNPNLPFILNLQYGYGEDRLAKGRFGIIRIAFKFMLSHADYVTAISNYLLNIAREYGYKGEAGVVHNGVDINKFKTQSEKLKTKIENEKIIITTSRLVYKNGIDILINAIREVKKDFPDIKCHIFGDGPEKENLEEIIGDNKLHDNIKLSGFISYEEIPKALHKADIFVRPSRSEGMGNSFIEALATGIPIIGTPVGGILDIIKDKETGLFCRVDDPKDLAEKIIHLLEDKDLAIKIVENGRKMIEERFSWDKISDSYRKIFQNVKNQIYNILVATPLFPPDIGGPATYSKILLDELPKSGIGVDIISFGTVRHLPKIIRHIIYFFKVLFLGRKADIIYAQDPVSVGFPSALAARLLGKRFILKVVGDYAWEQYRQRSKVSLEFPIFNLQFPNLDDFQKRKFDFVTELRRKAQRFAALEADLIITPSNYLKSIVSQWVIKKDKIKVVYNSYDEPDFNLSKEEARNKLNLEGTILISAGRLVFWKGFDTLIDLMPEILKKIPDAKLVIIGDGPEQKNYESRIKNYGLENNIILVGRILHQELLQYLKAGDFFVLNTGYEGLSHILLEAMAMEIPVVTTKICGNPEVIEHGVSGLLAEYNNKDEILKSILTIYQNKELREKIIYQAKQKVMMFSKDKMIKETMRWLQNPVS